MKSLYKATLVHEEVRPGLIGLYYRDAQGFLYRSWESTDWPKVVTEPEPVHEIELRLAVQNAQR